MTTMSAAASTDDEFFAMLWDDPPDRLLSPAVEGDPWIAFPDGDPTWRDYRLWEGYIDASMILLNAIRQRPGASRGLIFPALFTLRHALEAALKWHIRYAGGTVPRQAGHDLDALIAAFRATADGLDDEATYVCEPMLDLIHEIAAIDPQGTAFRYATRPDGSPVSLAGGPWDVRRLQFMIGHLTIWFDHLSGYIDTSSDEYQAMLRSLDSNGG